MIKVIKILFKIQENKHMTKCINILMQKKLLQILKAEQQKNAAVKK